MKYAWSMGCICLMLLGPATVVLAQETGYTVEGKRTIVRTPDIDRNVFITVKKGKKKRNYYGGIAKVSKTTVKINTGPKVLTFNAQNIVSINRQPFKKWYQAWQQQQRECPPQTMDQILQVLNKRTHKGYGIHHMANDIRAVTKQPFPYFFWIYKRTRKKQLQFFITELIKREFPPSHRQLVRLLNDATTNRMALSVLSKVKRARRSVAQELLQTVLTTGKLKYHQTRVILAYLQRVKNFDLESAVIETINSPNITSKNKRNLLVFLGRIGRERAQMFLTTFFADHISDVYKIAALQAVRKFKTAEMRKAVEAFFEPGRNFSPQVMYNAVNTLAWIGNYQSVPILIEALQAKGKQVQKSARSALCRLTGYDYGMEQHRWQSWWKTRVARRKKAQAFWSSTNKHEKVKALPYIDDLSVVSADELVALLNDFLAHVCQQAKDAILRVCQGQAHRQLQFGQKVAEMLINEELKQEKILFLLQLLQKLRINREIMIALLKNYKSDSPVMRKRTVVTIARLGSYQKRVARRFLLYVLKRESQEEILVEAIKGLKDLGSYKSISTLIAQLDSDSNLVRRAAHNALQQITGQKLEADVSNWNEWWNNRRRRSKR